MKLLYNELTYVLNRKHVLFRISGGMSIDHYIKEISTD